MSAPWVLDRLACPRDQQSLVVSGPERITCSRGHQYRIVDGIPVLLANELPATHPCLDETIAITEKGGGKPCDTVVAGNQVDPYVQNEILKTNGQLYRHLLGSLPRYPIPEIRLPPGRGATLLDVGCNWGRWTFAASRAGYRAVGIDPWIEGARAGQRVARQLGLDVQFVVGDARQLPFRNEAFDVAYSYSVLQHFSKADARTAWSEMARVTKESGTILVQMANIFGIRQAQNRLFRSAATAADPFRVRYWTPGELKKAGNDLVGPTRVMVDGFFSLNAQATDLDLMPSSLGIVIRASDLLRRVAKVVPPLGKIADSLYVESVRRALGPRSLP